jgi:hypothetical protein
LEALSIPEADEMHRILAQERRLVPRPEGNPSHEREKYQSGETSDGEISGSSTEVPGPDVIRKK